jgi:sucrose-6-phosphate hydrolase SacC (GH32 family)
MTEHNNNEERMFGLLEIKQKNNYRPELHFAPQKNWMNDPNGMVFYQGKYHLFFQHNPNKDVWGPMHWGHAVSEDMIHWEERAIALFPDELGMIFSGSIVVDWHDTSGFFNGGHGLVAIFTHHLDREQQPPEQYQSLAYSVDEGETWVKYDQNPVLKSEEKIDFRDPKVFWHEETNKWVMILATGQTVMMYSSKDLKDWQFESEFGEGVGYQEAVWECPDLFELPIDGTTDKKWLMIVSVGDNDKRDVGSKTQYFIGDFDGRVFTPIDTNVRWLDYGRDNYAGVSFSDIPEEDGRRIYLGWMSNWRYANVVPTDGWRSQMTLPRVLSLTDKGDSLIAKQEPVSELSSYVTDQLAMTARELTDDVTVPLFKEAMQIDLELQLDAADQVVITLQSQEDDQLTLTLDAHDEILTLDRSKAGQIDFSPLFKEVQTAPINTGHIQLSIVLDRSSIELFAGGGTSALTSLVYPHEHFSNLSLTSVNQRSSLVSGKVMRLS